MTKTTLLSCGTLTVGLALSASAAFAGDSAIEQGVVVIAEPVVTVQASQGNYAVATAETPQEWGFGIASFEGTPEAADTPLAQIETAGSIAIESSTVTAPQEAMGVTQIASTEDITYPDQIASTTDSPHIGANVIAFETATSSPGIGITSANAGFDTSQEGTVSSFVTSDASSFQTATV